MNDQFVEEMKRRMPVSMVPYVLKGKRAALVLVDENNGFCTPGAGNFAPPGPDARVDQMINETDQLARMMLENGHRVILHKDMHEPGVPEGNFPLHCERGSGEEDLVPQLQWLESGQWGNRVFTVEKDCNDGFVGAVDLKTHRNKMVDYINEHQIEVLVWVGICTDYCVLSPVLSTMSARNMGLMPSLGDMVVYERGTATYDLPLDVVREIGLPDTAAHPREETHHMALYTMANFGSIIASEVVFE